MFLCAVQQFYHLSMDRNKSNHISLLKEVLAEFDIETQVNKMAVKAFQNILRSHKQAFEYIAESEKKFIDFQNRLSKTEGFASAIQSSVNSKVEITNSINNRLQIFAKQFQDSMKQNAEQTIQMRKDYDALIKNTYKNTNDIRNLQNQIKKINSVSFNLDLKIQDQTMKIIDKFNNEFLATNEQMKNRRKQAQSLMNLMSQSKALIDSKSQTLQDLIKDISLYKQQKNSINNRFNDLIQQVGKKLIKSEFYDFKAIFDSRLLAERERSDELINNFGNSLKKQNQQLKNSQILLQKLIISNRKQQQQINLMLNNKNIEQDTFIKNQISSINSKLDQINKEIDSNDKQIKTIIDTNQKNTSKYLETHDKMFNEHANKLLLISKQLQDNSDMIKQHGSNIDSIVKSIDMIDKSIQNMNKEAEQRRSELAKMKISADAHSNVSGGLANVSENISKISESLSFMKDNIKKIESKLHQTNQKSMSFEMQFKQNIRNVQRLLANDKNQFNLKLTEQRRNMDLISIQIMKNLQKVENQCKQEAKIYANQIQENVRDRLKELNEVSKSMSEMKITFQAQMRQTQAVNKSIQQKVQKLSSMFTKFKSDTSIRVQGILNDQQRRSQEFKQLIKIVDDIRKHQGYLTQLVTVSLCENLIHQYIEENKLQIKENKQVIKISSLHEGWVIQIDDKGFKLRGTNVSAPNQRKKMIQTILTSFLTYSDKVKGSLIDDGKDVHQRLLGIQKQKQQFFQTRRKLSKRNQSQLPKLQFN